MTPNGGTARAGSPSQDSPVERYLDRLLVAAPGPPRQVRALVAEAEAHLRDATDEGLARGLSQLEAENQAVERFGTVRLVTGAEAQRQTLPFGTLIGQILTSGLLLGGIAAVAIGISGVVARVFQVFGGQRFLADIGPHTYLSAADCARWLAGAPAGQTCYQAAMADWASDVVLFRVAAGVLGLLALAAYALLRRQRWSRQWGVLPAAVTDTIAVVGFGAAGLGSLGLGVDWVIQSHNGAGQWLAAAPVALALALYFGLRLAKDVRQPPQVALALAG